MTATLAPALTKEEVERFHTDGVIGPFAICPPEEMAAIRARIADEVLPTDGPWEKHPEQLRHQDRRVVYDLVAHPEITGRIASLWGPDILVWRSNFFDKAPGGKAVPWHQDVNYWHLDPPLNLTAWMALDDVDEENACVQVIPGSHTKVIRHVRAGSEMHFEEMADPAAVDPSKAVKMVLKPGEFFLFNERVLHYSAPNTSNRHRKCMVLRYSLPFVKIPPLCPAHRLMMVSGTDRFGVNAFAEAPRA
ncbi:MAG: phytanoyl-CoA dioxygenase family protein [Planctomycetota bacterium]|nr:phytanoyl-CoA dioxygenase family protein [Planctomycetota bacterium]